MSYHPAYPTTADLLRETDAEERDVADLVALRDPKDHRSNGYQNPSKDCGGRRRFTRPRWLRSQNSVFDQATSPGGERSANRSL